MTQRAIHDPKTEMAVVAYELAAGDTLVESDGFMWRIAGITYYNGKYRLTLEPVNAKYPVRHGVSLKRSATVWIQRRNA